MNKQSRWGAWLAIIIGTLYFVLPLLSTFEFSLRMRRGEYSFDAYRVVFADARFQESFLMIPAPSKETPPNRPEVLAKV